MCLHEIFFFQAPLQLASPPGRSRARAAPSPTPPSVHSNRHQSVSDDDNTIEDKEEVNYHSHLELQRFCILMLFDFRFICLQIYYFQDQNSFIPASSRKFIDLQYLDLDLESSQISNPPTLPPAQSPPTSTVYKTVDFVKTEAFNRTRQRVEEERKQCTDGLS